jgi:hypothetical protein
MQIKVVVSCRACDGTPDFFATTIECSQEDYDEGEHYELAADRACEAGYEEISICYDENDGPPWLFGHLFSA